MAGFTYIDDGEAWLLHPYGIQRPSVAYDLPSWVELQYFRDRDPRIWWPPEYRGMTVPEFMRYLPRREERIRLVKPPDLFVPPGFKVRYFRHKEPVVFSPIEFRDMPLRQVNKMLNRAITPPPSFHTARECPTSSFDNWFTA